jgi:nucleoside-diphosphate-sugar epimerase
MALAGAAINDAVSVLAARPTFRRSWVNYVSKDYAYTSALAMRELGYAPKIDLKDGIKALAVWYGDRGYL